MQEIEGVPGEAVVALAQGASAFAQVEGVQPRWDPGKDNLGESFEIVTGVVKTALMPFAVVNRLGEWVTEKLDAALTKELRDVPPENIVPPLASIAGPALQGIGYSLEEDEIREMYVRLIASAMDGRQPGKAHPSYAAIVASLSAPETKYLPIVLADSSPLMEYRRTTDGIDGWIVVRTNVLPVVDLTTGEMLADPKLPEYLVNWQRLGLIDLDWTSFLTAPDAYSWSDEHPDGRLLRVAFGEKLQTANGVSRPTPFGRAFAAAVLPQEGVSTVGIRRPTAPDPAPSGVPVDGV